MDNHKAWIYCRVAHTDAKAVKAQKGWLEKSAAAKHLSVVGISEDQTNGCGTDRPGLAELTCAAKAGKIDVVLVWNIDRFFRPMTELMQYLIFLKEQGVQIITAVDGLIDMDLLLLPMNLLTAKQTMFL